MINSLTKYFVRETGVSKAKITRPVFDLSFVGFIAVKRR